MAYCAEARAPLCCQSSVASIIIRCTIRARDCIMDAVWEQNGDLLTSLKCDAGECIFSGEVHRESMSVQDALCQNAACLRQLRAISRILAASTLPTGVVRSGLI